MAAPTAVNTDHINHSSQNATSELGRRVSAMARRASAAIISTLNEKHSNFRSRIRSTFYGEDSIRVVPESVETHRALASISIAKTSSLRLLRQSTTVELEKYQDKPGDIEIGLEQGPTSKWDSTSVIPITSQMDRDESASTLYPQLRLQLGQYVESIPDAVQRDSFSSIWGQVLSSYTSFA